MLRTLVLLCVLMMTHSIAARVARAADDPQEGEWIARVQTPGGDLPFALTLERRGSGGWRALLRNATETVEVPVVTVGDGKVVLAIDYYDSRIEAGVEDGGRSLVGTWTKRRNAEEVASLPFMALAGPGPRFPQVRPVRGTPMHPTELIEGEWSVRFAKAGEAVGRFSLAGDGVVHGTFLTPTGDYRFLEGTFDGSLLRLSAFDGAHAFLFTAQMGESPDSLGGDFWSGGHWHDTWTATRTERADQPDPWAMTRPASGATLAGLVFKDLDGNDVTLTDERFRGRPMIVEVFGTWCPNCLDAMRLLKELDARHADAGLAIVGLAFEVTGDPVRDARQVRLYAERHGVGYPLLLAGRADKKRASAALPVIDAVRAYPTFLFVDRAGRIRSVYTGFSGPATGPDHARLRAEFERAVAEILR